MTQIQNVIVTAVLFDSREELDLELPAFLAVGELKRRITQLLRYYRPERYGGLEEISIRWGTRTLGDQETLAAAGIWDGSRIRILQSGG